MVGGSAMLFLVCLDEHRDSQILLSCAHGTSEAVHTASPHRPVHTQLEHSCLPKSPLTASALHHFRELVKTPTAEQNCLVFMHSSTVLTERWLMQVFVGEVLLQFHNCFNILYCTVTGEMSLMPGILTARVRGSCVLTCPQEMLELVLLPLAVVNIWCQLAPGKWWSGSVSAALQENTVLFYAQWLLSQCFWADSLLKCARTRCCFCGRYFLEINTVMSFY